MYASARDRRTCWRITVAIRSSLLKPENRSTSACDGWCLAMLCSLSIDRKVAGDFSVDRQRTEHRQTSAVAGGSGSVLWLQQRRSDRDGDSPARASVPSRGVHRWPWVLRRHPRHARPWHTAAHPPESLPSPRTPPEGCWGGSAAPATDPQGANC